MKAYKDAIGFVSKVMTDAWTFNGSWIVAFGLCLIASNCGAEHLFSGSGIINRQVRSPKGDGQVLAESSFRFRFSVSNELWLIHTENRGQSDFSFVEDSYDGTNVYHITKISEDAYTNKPVAFDRDRNTNIIAAIYPTDVPPMGFDPIGVVWLACCSGRFFRSSTDNLSRPLWNETEPSLYAMDYLVHTVFDLLSVEPPIISRCVQFCDGFEYGLDNGSVPRIARLFRYPAPYDSGFPRSMYQVTETMNVGGRVFPKRFQLQNLIPREHGGSTNALIAFCQYDGVVDQIDYGTALFEAEGRIVPRAGVVDYRTLKQTPARKRVQYKNPTSHWLPMSAGFLPYELYKANVSAQPLGDPVSISSGRGRPVRIFMLALLLFPLGWLVVQWVRKKCERVGS